MALLVFPYPYIQLHFQSSPTTPRAVFMFLGFERGKAMKTKSKYLLGFTLVLIFTMLFTSMAFGDTISNRGNC